MAVKISPEERKQYLVDKINQLNVTFDVVAETCHLPSQMIQEYITGSKLIDDKAWVQVGLGLARLAKKLGVPTEKEEKKAPTVKRISRTSIIKQVEKLDFFNEN